MQVGIDDSMFFDRFKDEQSIIYASCRTNEGARAIIYYDGVNTPDFVEIVNGHVGRMAHLSMKGREFTVDETNGGLWTIEKIRSSVSSMLSLPLHYGAVADLKTALYANNANLSPCGK